MRDEDRLTLRAGAGQADITPPMGTQIDGDIGRWRPAEAVLDPIYAKALALEQNGRRFCFLSMDLLSVDNEWADKVRAMAAERFGFEREAIAVHVTQTHAAPSMGHMVLSNRLPDVAK